MCQNLYADKSVCSVGTIELKWLICELHFIINRHFISCHYSVDALQKGAKTFLKK